MLETLKSLAFVIITVMIALLLQAHAAQLVPEQLENASIDATGAQQLQVYN